MFYVAETFLSWGLLFKQLNPLLANNKKLQFFLMFLLFTLTYGFVIFRFVKLYWETQTARLQIQTQLKIEEERTKQLEAVNKK